MVPFDSCDEKYGPLLAEHHSGGLAEDQLEDLRKHLDQCPGCRDQDKELAQLVESLRAVATTGPLLHPTPEQMATLAGNGSELKPNERRSIEEHLAGCQSCKAEWNVVTGWNLSSLQKPASMKATSRSRSGWVWFGSGALTAAVAAGLIFVIFLGTTGLDGVLLEPHSLPVQIQGANHRAPTDATLVQRPEGGGKLTVSLTVEAAPGDRLLLQLMATETGEIVAEEELQLVDSSGMILFSVESSSMPESGEFRITLQETGELLHYPFSIQD